MKQYISKSALVAELNRLIAELVEEGEGTMFEQGRISAFEDVKVFINHTLEVKEEPASNDLEAEFILYLKHKFNIPQEGNTLKTDGWRPSPYDILDIAKHFAQWQKKQEVKEVDLEKEIHNAADQYDINNNGNIYWEDIVGFAKHFFELGLKAQKGG